MATNEYKKITVKNADGDADTTATIIIQNKIDYTPKVSVIIPVYNVEQYLRECLDSVINQTLKEIEIICVDDGSTDSSLDILKEYANRDNRITVITQENLHAGVARNAGLSVAKGEYVHFLDSDDWVDLDTYEKLYNIIKKQNANLIKFKSYTYDSQTKQIINNAYTEMGYIKNDVMISIDADARLAIEISDSPWSGFYNLNFINKNGIRFDNLICVNDVGFYFRCLTKSRNVYFVNSKFVYYRVNNQKSLVGIRPRNFDCQIKAYYNIQNIVKNESAQIIEILQERFSMAIFWRFKAYLEDKNIDDKTKENIRYLTKKFFEDNPDSKCKEAYNEYTKKTSATCGIKMSVIIPVYNVEKYLRECLDSVINQTLKEIEIICVDDGSTDKSLEILKEYANKDPRITVLSQPNQRQGAARNKGIKIAKGEYISFIDADDWIDKKCLESLYNKIENEQSDICIYGLIRYNEQTKEQKILGWLDTSLYSGRSKNPTNWQDIRQAIFTHLGPVCKIYKREFVINNRLFFTENVVFEDVIFSVKSVILAKKISILDENLYFYRRETGASTMDTSTKTPHIDDVILFLQNTFDFLNDQGVYSELLNEYLLFLLEQIQFHTERISGMYKLTLLNRFEKFIIDNNIRDKILTNDKFNKMYSKLLALKFTDIIISLTSYPARIGTVNQTIESLLNQTKKADKVILWLAPEQFPNREADLPTQLLDLRDKGLEIDWCQDIKSYKKLIPALKKYPDALIVTADDDLIFASNWLKTLYNGYLKHPKDISIHRATKFYHDEYGWHVIAGGVEFYTDGSPLNKICSGAGAIYPPHCFYEDILNEDLFLKLAPTNDDQWIWFQSILNGKKIYVVDNNIPTLTYVPGTQESGLTKINDNGQKLFWKDFNRLIEHYPQAEEILLNEAKTHKVKKQFVAPYRKELENWYNRMCIPINLDYPRTFNEKIQWSKIYDSTPIKTRLADKYLVRDWVAEKIGDKYLIPLLGVYDSFEEIDFDKLPNQFVIKCNHGCAYNIIVKDKSKLDLTDVKAKLDKWMSENFAFKNAYELHYRDIPKKIIIEKYMDDGTGDLRDYKFTCFNGKPEFIWIDSDRHTEHKRNLYDLNWNQLNCKVNTKYDTFPSPEKPKCLNEMIQLAKILSSGFNYVRVDFYIINDKIYFGEMTFTSSSGTEDIWPEHFATMLAKKYNLPKLAYNIDTGTYYKLPKTHRLRIKPYLLFPYYLIKTWCLRRKRDRMRAEQIVSAIRTWRIDIMHANTDGSIDVYDDPDCLKKPNCQKPKWMNGRGVMVTDDAKSAYFNIQCKESGIVNFFFRGMDRRYNDERIPVYIKYTSIKIDGEEMLSAPVIAWHDVPFKFTKNVKDGQEISVCVKTAPYVYTPDELAILLKKLYPNENISAIIRAYCDTDLLYAMMYDQGE